jgi:thioredoxin 1
MPSHEITSDQFDLVISNHDIVFVDFWAEWCAPCKNFSRVYEQVVEQFPLIHFVTVNIEQEQQLAVFFDVRSIPHLIIFKEGVIIYSEAGTIPEYTIEELAQQSFEFDVSGIRAQLDSPAE